MKKQRDYQRSKVYAWEKKCFPMPKEEMSLDECKTLACELLSRKRVVVKDGRGTRHAFAYCNNRVPTIGLPKWARNRIVVCHEVAHLIADGDDVPAHGAEFMRTYIELLDRLGLYHAEELIEDALDYGLRVAGHRSRPKKAEKPTPPWFAEVEMFQR